MKEKTTKISLGICFLLTLGCMNTFNMNSEAKNYEKAEKLFDIYFSKNNNAFLFSSGTVGPKYVWTHLENQKIKLMIIDLKGHKEEQQINDIQNWTLNEISSFTEPDCPFILDGDLLKIRFKNNDGNTFDQTLIHEFECLKMQKQKVIKKAISEMNTLKIK